MYCLQVCPCIFQPGNLTGLSSEGVKVDDKRHSRKAEEWVKKCRHWENGLTDYDERARNPGC